MSTTADIYLRVTERLHPSHAWNVSVSSITSDQLQYDHQCETEKIIHQNSPHSLCIISASNNAYHEIYLANARILNFTHYEHYLVILTEPQHSNAQNLIVLNMHNLLYGSHQSHNDELLEIHTISEDEVVDCEEIGSFRASSSPHFDTYQQLETLFECVNNRSSTATLETEHQEPRRKKRKTSSHRVPEANNNNRNQSNVVCSLHDNQKNACHAKYDVTIGDEDYLNDHPNSILLCCRNLLSDHGQHVHHPLTFNKVIFVPSVTYESCIELLLTFTKIVSAQQVEIGLNLLALTLTLKRKNSKKRKKSNAEIKSDSFTIWTQSVLTVDNKINPVSLIKRQCQSWMESNGLSDHDVFKSVTDIKCVSASFVCCSEQDKYTKYDIIDKKLANSLFGEQNKDPLILLTGWSHGKLYWFDISFYLKKKRSKRSYLNRYHGEIRLDHMNQPLTHFGPLRLEDDTQCLCVIGAFGVINLIYPNKTSNSAHSPRYICNLYRTQIPFVETGCIVDGKHLFLTNEHGTLHQVLFNFDSNDFDVSHQLLNRLNHSQHSVSASSIRSTPSFVTTKLCSFRDDESNLFCDRMKLWSMCKGAEGQMIVVNTNGVCYVEVVATEANRDVVIEQYLSYDAKLEMKRLLDNMSCLSLLEKQAFSLQTSLNQRLYCRHIARSIAWWIQHKQAEIFAANTDVRLVGSHLEMKIHLTNNSQIPFQAQWMKYFSLNVLLKYTLYDGQERFIHHNIPLSYHDGDSFQVEDSRQWSTNILIDCKLLTYSDIHYHVYFVPHLAMDAYQSQTDLRQVESTQHCQKIALPFNDTVLLTENDVDFLCMLSPTQIPPVLVLPFTHLKQIECYHRNKSEKEHQHTKKLMDCIQRNKAVNKREIEQNTEDSDSEDNHNRLRNSPSMDMETTEHNRLCLSPYNGQSNVLSDEFDAFGFEMNGGHSDPLLYDNNGNECELLGDRDSHEDDDDDDDDDDDCLPPYKVFDDEAEEAVKAKQKEIVPRPQERKQVMLKQELLIPAPMKHDCVESKWNSLHRNVFGVVHEKCMQSVTDQSMTMKGYLLNGDSLMIHCEQSESHSQWKLILQILSHRKAYDVEDHNVQYLLCRIRHCIAKRVWQYYSAQCLQPKKGNEMEHKMDDAKKQKEHRDENLKLLQDLFDNEETENVLHERYVEQSVALDQYVLRKLQALKPEWNKYYHAYTATEQSEECEHDLVDIDLANGLQHVSLQIFQLYREYVTNQEKQSMIACDGT